MDKSLKDGVVDIKRQGDKIILVKLLIGDLVLNVITLLNDDIRERLGVTPIEEKLVQHYLRWFGHIQRRPVEAPIRNWVIR
jgi:hypothetical protein